MADADVVIIGGGSAGSAAAHALARTGLAVWLIEAGPDYGPLDGGNWPRDLLDPRRLPISHDWGLAEERGEDSFPEPRAKVLGGCSAHNQCGAVWALPEDYERWAELTGNERRRYEKIRPLFDHIEDAQGAAGTWRGRGGLVPVRKPQEHELATWQRAFLSAAHRAGFLEIDDLGAPDGRDGAAPFHQNIRGTVRWNAAFAFIDPLRHLSAFRILYRTLADRLIFEEGRAVALLCLSAGGSVEVRARHFVLAAGVYGSPAILMRSGIGPASHLQDIGVPVVLDLPGVGANLHDHPGIGLRYPARHNGHEAVASDLSAGRLAQSQVALRHDDGGVHVLPYQAVTGEGEWMFELLGFAMRPKSRGLGRLRGADPTLPPQIDFRFLSDPDGHDLTVLEGGPRANAAFGDDPAAERPRGAILPH